MKENDEMYEFVKDIDVVLPLEPRDAFFGGRTNPIVLDYSAQDGEKIQYADYISLYPTMVKNRSFPLGHPEIFTEHFEEVSAEKTPYFGLIKCEILPPRGLYHPVLPMRSDGKLQFPLCRTCTDKLSSTACTCSDAERVLKGSWCTIEVEKALKMGYQMKRIHEVWHYSRRSDPKNSTSKAFLIFYLQKKRYFNSNFSLIQLEHLRGTFVYSHPWSTYRR